MKEVKINKKCIVRNQECKRIFEGSRICFIACPNNDEVALELQIIQQSLREANIEPYIAVENREYQKDIFCEKICSKIIESQLCIVILNDVVDKKDNITKPNANVYYEYGLMTAFCKKIIPVQLENQNLAFNIQSLDTLKYNKKNFKAQIDEAVQIMLLSTEEDNELLISSSNFDLILDILGLVKIFEFSELKKLKPIIQDNLYFSSYSSNEDKLFFVGKFEDNILPVLESVRKRHPSSNVFLLPCELLISELFWSIVSLPVFLRSPNILCF
jgi:hypothetical protein